MIKGPCGDCEKLERMLRLPRRRLSADRRLPGLGPALLEEPGPADDILFLPVDAARLVPHKPPMLLIDRLLEVKERASVSEMTVQGRLDLRERHAARWTRPPIRRSFPRPLPPRKGSASSAAGIRSPEGFLLGRQETRGPGHAPVSATPSASRCSRPRKYGDFGIVHGESVPRTGKLIARGEVKVFQSDNGTVRQ